MQSCLDEIIIIDSSVERGQDIKTLLSGRSKIVELILMDADNIKPAQDEFRKNINDLLQNKSSVMVFLNCLAGVRGGILTILREAERVHNIGTRRILVSCKSGGQVKRGFRKRGLRLGSGIRHIRYGLDGRYLEKIDELFRFNC